MIRVRNLTVGYGEDIVLEGVSFDVQAGEVFAVLGTSGCGKSTLFRAIVGLLRPMSGEILLDGIQVSDRTSEEAHRDLMKRVGVMFQSGALFSSMTVAENVAFPIRAHTSLPENIIESIVLSKLSDVGLADYAGFYPSEISGGMKKRAALARAVALDPKVVFFDEPSAGLDPVNSARLDRLILDINGHIGSTVVIVTHELPSILEIVDRAVMLDKEEKGIIAEGAPAEMAHSSDSRVRDFFSRRPGTSIGGERRF
jgi:phospholipid/cholesterol/gamma-HCH transport system ATP-binding protein